MINTRLLTDLAANASFTTDAILIDIPKTANFQSLIISLENHFAVWAKLMNKKMAVVRSQTGGEVRIPASLAVPMVDVAPAESEPQNLLWFANVPVSLRVLTAANDLIQRPRRGGIVRLSDELQVILHDSISLSNPGHTMQEATNWRREQYWHPTDLEEFRRLSRAQNNIEFTWRSFDPALGMNDRTPGNWLEFTVAYQLLEDEFGESFHFFESRDWREIEPPVGVTLR
ncbi:hypothetical protein [Fischerella sp. PCC 9605]|uniref:hypothetical protein n=1 Tax=Fischerella sp. PCC 9605 TaxID=1173024 RepID=UPI00047D55EE|nr:hypothetical protein [Fischerella sp. PCC 9605]